MIPAVTFEGNLVDDPEIRFTGSGKAVANFTLACTERVRDGSGGWKDGETTFVRCTAWARLAEHLAESAVKGDALVVSGSLRQHNWETSEGDKRSQLQVTAYSVGLALTFTAIKTPRNGGVGAAAAQPAATASTAPAHDDEPPF